MWRRVDLLHGRPALGDEAERKSQTTLHHLATGVPVAVRCSFEGTWSPGFEVAEFVLEPDGGAGYRLRRLSDGTLLPVIFPINYVIPLVVPGLAHASALRRGPDHG